MPARCAAGSASCWPKAAAFATPCCSRTRHRAAAGEDDKALRGVAELAAALAPSKERHLETTAQGNAFVEATRAAWPCAALDRLKAVWDGPVAYPVAVAAAAAGHGIALEPALAAFLQALAANWVSAGVRLVPLGQTDGQRVLGRARAGHRRHRATRARRRARRHRLVGLPRRSRQRPARDAIHAAVQVMISLSWHGHRPGR